MTPNARALRQAMSAISGLALLLAQGFAWGNDRPLDQIDPPDDSALYEVDTNGTRYAFLEQQIFRGESDTALAQLEADIEQIEMARHRYHEDLIVPLTLSGDAFMVQGQHNKALDRYERARHVARVSTGLFAESQLPVVYREADVYRRLGDLRTSAQREEYAYEIAKKSFGEYSPEALPTLYRLAQFYLDTYNYLSARSLYNRALGIVEQQQLGTTAAAIPALQGIAVSHRLARFPPFYIHSANDNSRFDGPTPALTTSDLEEQHIAFNNFPAGEKALQRIVEIRQQSMPEDQEAIAQAITALGDWHLLFGRSQAASVLYKHVAANIDAPSAEAIETAEQSPGTEDAPGTEGTEVTPDAKDGEAAEEQTQTAAVLETENTRFANPTLIYFPVPNNPSVPKNATPDDGVAGYVTLSFDVGPTGRIRKLKTADAYPPKLMDFRVRRSMRQAVFRPRLENGVAVVAEDQSYTHHFTFFPKALTPEQRADLPAPSEEGQTGISDPKQDAEDPA